MSDKINFIFRKKAAGNSIEELFTNIIKCITNSGVRCYSFELPHGKISIDNMFKNIKYVAAINGIIHITGDVHYVALNPFKKMVLTIHDVESAMKGKAIEKYLKILIWFWIPSLFVKRITVISEFSKSQLIQLIPWAKKKITVIHNPVSTLLNENRKDINVNEPTILHIGTKENKNLENTILALKNIKCRLIVVGKLNEKQSNLLTQYHIKYENFVDIQFSQVKELYEKSDIVSFISKYEGFGMPVIEAQKVGRALITSRSASIPEIAGSGAHFVDYDDVNDIESGYLRLINDKEYRENLIEMGFKNVKRFDVKEIVLKYLNVYEQIK